MIEITGKLLVKRRKQLGLSQGDIVRETGKQRSVVSKYETGRIPMRNINGALKLLEAYGYDLVEIDKK